MNHSLCCVGVYDRLKISLWSVQGTTTGKIRGRFRSYNDDQNGLYLPDTYQKTLDEKKVHELVHKRSSASDFPVASLPGNQEGCSSSVQTSQKSESQLSRFWLPSESLALQDEELRASSFKSIN